MRPGSSAAIRNDFALRRRRTCIAAGRRAFGPFRSLLTVSSWICSKYPTRLSYLVKSMATAAKNRVLPFMAKAAGATFYQVLRLSHRLDHRWPGLGCRTRRPLLLLWANVTAGMSDRLRNRLRGESRAVSAEAGCRPDVAPESIALLPCDVPVVSVIIPTYGRLPITLRCLASIQRHFPTTPAEIIVVDDAFPGLEAEALARVPGIRLQRNLATRGFLRTCNAAAQTARGEFLLFLSNATEVRAGWLDRLVEVFACAEDAGLVGSKLLGDELRLQAAGGILWQDGTACNDGCDADPDAPEFNYLRTVDYCSAASLMIRRQVFVSVGGFDAAYAPTSFAAVDLSVRLRRLGLRTCYQPRSEVIHYDATAQPHHPCFESESYQRARPAKSVETWQDVLTREQYPQATHRLRARERAHDRQVILVVDQDIPQTDRDAGSCAVVAVMRALLAAGMVVKFWPFDLHRTPGHTEALQDMGVEVFYRPYHTSLDAWLQANGAELDMVLLSRPAVAEACLPAVRANTAARIIYYGVDLHFRRMMARAELNRDDRERRAAEAMRKLETRLWHAADTVLYLSDEEAADVRSLEPAVNVRSVIPYAFHAGPAADILRDDRPGEPLVLFVAGFGHLPNVDAVAWFVSEVLPLVLMQVPAAQLAIVGSNPPPSVRALRGPRVELFADVAAAELLAWYRRARVAVVPLQTGAGVKLKSVEALWHGVPVVLSPVGAQGLPGVDSVAAIASQPHAFAAAVAGLLTDDALWRRRRVAAAGYARARFTEAAQRQSLLQALDIGAPPVACRRVA